jgi:hypothetical protein
LKLPVENVILLTAFGNKMRSIKKHVHLEFKIAGDAFEHVFLIYAQLVGSLI